MLSSAFCHLSVGDRRGSNTDGPESTAREIRSGGEALRHGADMRDIGPKRPVTGRQRWNSMLKWEPLKNGVRKMG